MANIVDYFASYTELSGKIYWVLYEGAPQIVLWFITPLAESSNDTLLAELFGESTPLELTIGVGVIVVLVMGIVKYFTSITPL